ncbi:ParB-like chromosome segregation protein Spo0J [Streptomyces sp. SAI-144]|jgi:ParB-like chromosome segregation protein Spo0J|uniref:ParB/RepB/Spo0J family partition protein n=1 Tax=unclassified Streptomyces TaxID=2593676 RepID=UPI00247484B3|nr:MULTISPECIES: ParB N-terminal domain-containing protein [unclassified Streptomyces]MDH6439240.1 ParB-like chromosome segregation protein Spo0J [Streptomyces sp. SAI-144]MDH6486622.1 ParB-like chromosome segregation protein Spo0J [Streptomyces sp. SAI-127]
MSDRPDPGRYVVTDDEVVRLPVAALVLKGSPRAAGEDEEHVRSLIAAERDLPPIIVHHATMRVIDGAHRVRAARLRGQEHITARYFRGSVEDSFVLAVRANIGHGLPLSLKDRISAAERIVTTHPQWSDRMIASVAGISARTVAEIRRRKTADACSGVRIGQDGRARPVDASRRRSLATALLTENPDLSLRQVAQAAGISPETVRAVRNRLLYGRQSAPARTSKPPPRNQARPPVDQDEVLRRLAADPAVRQTDAGRALLRVLRVQAMTGEEWQKIVDNVPAHCAQLVEQAARESARVWDDIAARIAQKTSLAD